MKRLIAGAVAAGALSLGTFAGTAEAQPPIAVGNLVNVQVVDVLNNNNVVIDVDVPVNAAVAICDAVDANVGAGVLGNAVVFADGLQVSDCDAIANQ